MAAEAVADRLGFDLTNGTILQAVFLDTEWEEEGEREEKGEIERGGRGVGGGEKREGICFCPLSKCASDSTSKASSVCRLDFKCP